MQVHLKRHVYEAADNADGTVTLVDPNGVARVLTADQFSALYESACVLQPVGASVVEARIAMLEVKVNALMHHATDPSETSFYELTHSAEMLARKNADDMQQFGTKGEEH